MGWNYMFDIWCYANVSNQVGELLDVAAREGYEPWELLRLEFVPTGGDYTWSSLSVQ